MPRKGENIYKRKDGRWEARYIHHYEGGKAKYKSIYGNSYTEVRAKRLEELSKPENMKATAVKQLSTLQEICVLWLKTKKPDVKESTYTRYVRAVDKYILPAFEIRQLIKIDKTVIFAAFDMLKKRLSDKTVSDIRCIFKSIWKYGIENQYPCCEFHFPRRKEKPSHKILVIPADTRKRMEAALLECNNQVSLGVFFTLFTGVRIGELCGLKWGDIDFDNGYVHIRRTVERIADLTNSHQKTKVIISEPKTENSERIIPLPSCLIEYIRRFRLSDDKYILSAGCVPTEPRAFYAKYKQFLLQNNLGDHTFHELRHTFATQCVDMGFDVKSLSEILGHSIVTTTMNLYVPPTLQMKKRQMEKLTMSVNSPSK